jgi:CDP-glucose 4,6-dehydratase
VLEPLGGYLTYVEALARGGAVPPALNFGPLPGPAMTVAAVANAMLKAFGSSSGWRPADDGTTPVKEADALALDPALAGRTLGWRPRLSADETLAWTADWYRAFNGGGDARTLCLDQLKRYESMA